MQLAKREAQPCVCFLLIPVYATGYYNDIKYIWADGYFATEANLMCTIE